MLTLTRRLLLAFIFLCGTVLCGFSLFIYGDLAAAETAKLDARLESYLDKVATEIEEQTDGGVFPEPEEFHAIRAETLSGAHMQLLDAGGTSILADSLLATLPPFPDYREAPSTSTERAGGEPFRVMRALAPGGNGRWVRVTVAASLREIEEQLASFRWLILVGIPLALIAASLAAYSLIRRAFAPLTSMITTARGMTADNLDRRLALSPAKDEVRLLGETFNGMIERLQHAFARERQFVSDASHEIRTPLAILRAELDFLLSHPPREEADEAINSAIGEVDRQAALASSLLLLSRLESTPPAGDRGSVRIDEILVECYGSTEAAFKDKGVVLSIHIDEGAEVRGDPEGVRCIMVNLLDNALKYTPRGGSVRLRLATEDGGRSTRLDVEDTGCGISPDETEKIFRRFYRSPDVRGKQPGSGLGLAIVERLATLFGGRVEVVSAPGQGSRFSVILPTC